MTIDAETLAKYEKAGRIAARALAHGASLVKEGAVVRDVLDEVEAFIEKRGGKPAFPAQASIDETAAHSCPLEDDMTVFTRGQLVKLDVGVHVDGYVGDNAVTVSLAPQNKEHERLIEASRAARDAAIKIAKAGVTPHELGAAIEREIVKRGFQPIRNLSGHGLGRFQIHTAPSIPNYANHDDRPLLEGMVVAVEPFATTGSGSVRNGSDATLFALAANKPVRSPYAREALDVIRRWQGLPFTTRWLSAELGAGKTALALKQLKLAGVLHEYPPLVEQARGLVSQSEHTILIMKDGARILTTDEE